MLSASALFLQEAQHRLQGLMSGVRYLDAAHWLSTPEHVQLLKTMQQQTAFFMVPPKGKDDRLQRQRHWQALQQRYAPALDEVLLFVGRRHQYLRSQAQLGERYAGAVVHLYMTQLLELYNTMPRLASA